MPPLYSHYWLRRLALRNTRRRPDKRPREVTDPIASRDAERAYKRSLSNIPDEAPADPWGHVRSDSPSKPVAKPPVKPVAKGPTKRIKAGGAD